MLTIGFLTGPLASPEYYVEYAPACGVKTRFGSKFMNRAPRAACISLAALAFAIMMRYILTASSFLAVAGFLSHPCAPKAPRRTRRTIDAPRARTARRASDPGIDELYAAPRTERQGERKTTLEGDSRVVTLEKTMDIGDPQLKLQKETGMEDMLKELREIQGSANRTYCILGSRHCSYLHQQIIELLSYALVLSGNHVYTSGAAGTNAAVIRGALRANATDLLTVILPQSRSRQTEDCQELIAEVTQVVSLPENDALSLEVASKRCNRRLVKETEHLIAFAFHDSNTIVQTTVEAKEMDKLVTVMYLD